MIKVYPIGEMGERRYIMDKELMLSKVRKIVREYNKEINMGRSALIMFDKSDGEIWVDVFAGIGDTWKEYISDSIIRLMYGEYGFVEKEVNVENVMNMIEHHLSY